MQLTIKKHHQEQYDYDYYEVQFKGASYKFVGCKEDVIAQLEKDLEHMKGDNLDTK